MLTCGHLVGVGTASKETPPLQPYLPPCGKKCTKVVPSPSSFALRPYYCRSYYPFRPFVPGCSSHTQEPPQSKSTLQAWVSVILCLILISSFSHIAGILRGFDGCQVSSSQVLELLVMLRASLLRWFIWLLPVDYFCPSSSSDWSNRCGASNLTMVNNVPFSSVPLVWLLFVYKRYLWLISVYGPSGSTRLLADIAETKCWSREHHDLMWEASLVFILSLLLQVFGGMPLFLRRHRKTKRSSVAIVNLPAEIWYVFLSSSVSLSPFTRLITV